MKRICGESKDNENWSPASLNHAMRPSLIEAKRNEIRYAFVTIPLLFSFLGSKNQKGGPYFLLPVSIPKVGEKFEYRKVWIRGFICSKSFVYC
ncbi:hypothetical protein GLYMA_20G238200v4 [Glycine max]|uniref:Uncharacterized protein n=1 Tax=Glycine max TaxID=3847 RepID=K7N5B3_SOYBN|nr:hypothetical protein JHK85_058150 [Glycine max]KAH1037702.1 hypothetical protein GYH30_056834 [Glycine max]KRG92927.1 hypothetical protein GLYMA_20G238200v4 [Glycine max]